MTAYDDDLDLLAEKLLDSDGAVVLSGAGVSVSSDIPAFRGEGGLWDRFDPMEYAHIRAFVERPAEVWEMLRELEAVLDAAEPNPAHEAIATLQRHGYVTSVITQNVDGLHQAAGSHDVIELHGSRGTLTCLDCGSTVGRAEVVGTVRAGDVPRCGCGGLLKPDVTFFGEELPSGAMARAEAAIRASDLLLVVGTSAEVYPAAALPELARATGSDVWEVNPEPGDPIARGIPLPAEDALPRLLERLPPHDREELRPLRGSNPSRSLRGRSGGVGAEDERDGRDRRRLL